MLDLRPGPGGGGGGGGGGGSGVGGLLLPAGLGELALRLPPLFVMDAMLLQDLGLKSYLESRASITLEDDANAARTVYIRTAEQAGLDPSTIPSDWVALPYVVSFFCCLLVYLVSAFILTLNPNQLILTYWYLFGLACLPASYLSQGVMIDELFKGEPTGAAPSHFLSASFPVIAQSLSPQASAVAANLLIQLLLASMLTALLRFHFLEANTLFRVISLSFTGPIWIALAGFDEAFVQMTAVMSVVLPSCLTLFAVWSLVGPVARSIRHMVTNKRQFVLHFGLNTFLETEWARLRVPTLLRTFWLSRMACLLGLELYRVVSHEELLASNFAVGILLEQVLLSGRILVARGAETFIAVLGMTAVVSTLCHYVGVLFHCFIHATAEDDEERSVASVSAVIFFVLSLQTGLTSLDVEERFVRLGKNLCLLVTALFHFIHNMVSPVLQSLSASHSINNRKHARALCICTLLVVAPVGLMWLLWKHFTVGTWMLTVTAFCIEVIVNVTVTVCVYLLFLYDHHCRSAMWESLDDAVYYVKAVGNSIEFCFAIFLFFNGGFILFFESGGTLRAIMMLIHAYCNIWCEAKAGWQTFIKRRTAVTKINSLSDATDQELSEYNDVCAICYQNMTSAKFTQCRHLFHGVCLRKWLYKQDTCPLCQSPLYKAQNLQQSQQSQYNNRQQQVDLRAHLAAAEEEFMAAADVASITSPDESSASRRNSERASNDEPPPSGDDPETASLEELIDNDLSEEDSFDSGSSDSEAGPSHNHADMSALQDIGDTSDDDDGVATDHDIIYDSLEDFGLESEDLDEDPDEEQSENVAI